MAPADLRHPIPVNAGRAFSACAVGCKGADLDMRDDHKVGVLGLHRGWSGEAVVDVPCKTP